jgi:MtN3 and saliva related transmembrane protein
MHGAWVGRLSFSRLMSTLHALPVPCRSPVAGASPRSLWHASLGTMMQDFIQWIGVCAAVLTSLSYIPQVRKAWPRGSTSDLSLKMLLALTAGLALWIVYGFLKSDWVIVAANGVGATLSGSVLIFKIRDLYSKRS